MKKNSIKINYIITLIGSMFIGFVGIYLYVSYEPIMESDLTELTGTISNWEYKRFSKAGYQLEIKLEEFRATFYVWSVPVKAVNQEKMTQMIEGDILRVAISNNQEEHLFINNKLIAVFEIYNIKDEKILNYHDVIELEKENAHLGIYLVVISLVATTLIYRLYKKYIINLSVSK